MKQLLIPSLLLLMVTACEDDPVIKNQPPVAIAGNDTTIVLPVDNVALNGSESYDGEGKIKTYRWRQVSGPKPATIGNYLQAKVRAANLAAGEYLFELRVTDDHDLYSKDSMMVRVEPALPAKISANAGQDQILLDGKSSATLDGNASSDPPGAILNFEWRQIAGEQSIIKSPFERKTTVLISKPGNYQFELKVFNSNGKAYDTTTVIVNNSSECEVTRPKMEVSFNHLKQLPAGAGVAGMIAAGNKLLFPPASPISANNDKGLLYIYDIVTGELNNTEMELPTTGHSVAVVENKVFFAGGGIYGGWDFDLTNYVQIYDLPTNSWSSAKLSEPRAFMAAATLGSKVYFAGGLKSLDAFSKKVDIFDNQTGTWSTSEFKGAPRAIQSVVTAKNKIFFMGGYTSIDGWFGFLEKPIRTIDIFNGNNDEWEIDDLQVNRDNLMAIAVDEKIFIAGENPVVYHEKLPLNVEVINANNNGRSNLCLPNTGLAGVGSKNNSVIFMHSEKKQIDIYNTSTGQWSIAESKFSSYNSIATVNNELYVLVGRELYKMNF